MAHIEKRQTAGGVRYEVRWRVDGRERSRSFDRLADARAHAATEEAAAVLGIAIDPANGRRTLNNYWVSWWASNRARLAETTRARYEQAWNLHIADVLGRRPLGKLRPEDVRLWHAELVERRSWSVAASAYRVLRRVLNEAVDDGIIAKNPCRISGASEDRSAERPYVSPGEVLELVDAIDERFRAVVVLAGFAGLRRGELIGLRRRHVDLVHGVVVVEVEHVFVDGGRRVVKEPKTRAGYRTVTLPAVVRDVLAEHLDRFTPADRDAPVFVGARGVPLRPKAIYRAWATARDAIGRPELHLHDLRHAAGTMAAATGATPRDIMARIGHSSTRAAAKYQHTVQTRDGAVARGLDAMVETAQTQRVRRAAVVPIRGTAT
jgi:integrase